MALIIEDGTGVAGAESYADTATIDAYWQERPHNPLAAIWEGADAGEKEGAARESTAFLDASYALAYRGYRKSYDQGREWPRDRAMDAAANPLPDLPIQLVWAVCELSARSLSGALVVDVPVGSGKVKRISEAVGPLKTDIEYTEGGEITGAERYTFVHDMLGPILRVSLGWEWR